MRLSKRLFTLILGLMLGVLLVRAQGIEVRAALDSNTLLIGAQTKLQLEVRKPKAAYVQFPLFKDTLNSAIEVLMVSALDSIEEAGQILLRQSLTLTSFDSGYHIIPPFLFTVGNVDTFETNSLGLEVLLVPVDTTQAIKPIKGPIQVPRSWWRILYGLLGLLLVVVVVLYFKNRKVEEKKPEALPIPKKAPHFIALEALAQVRKERLWQSGAIKDYYSKITDILRVYIEERFEVPAVEQISEAIIMELKAKQAIQIEHVAQLEELMRLADLVKFAKGKPTPQDNEIILEKAITFVEGTAKGNTALEKNNEVI